MLLTIQENTGALLTGLFRTSPDEKRSVKLLNNILLVLLFLFGLLLWFRFLNYGQIPDDRLDWGDLTYPRLIVVQQAVQQGVIPFHVDQGMKWGTNRYLSVPDLLLSPQVIFLKWLSVERFLLLQILLMYSIGFWGLILFKCRFHLSLAAFLPLFLLFNFNGHITAHLAVGHITWTAYFLLPFWVLLLLDILQDPPISWVWVTKFSLLQLLIFLQGGYHPFVWILFFMSFLLIVSPGKRQGIFWGMFFAVLVNVYRILPGALLQEVLSLGFMAGFPTTTHLLKSLFEIVPLESAYSVVNRVNVLVWELDFFVGVIGGLFLLLGIWNLYQHRRDTSSRLILPTVMLLALSMGNLYKPFFDSGIPLLSGERISSRFMILPLLILLFLGSIQLQKLFDDHPSYSISGCFALLALLLANDLTQHLGHWDILQMPSEVFPKSPVLAVIQDPIYSILLWSGLGISLTSVLFLLAKIWLRKILRFLDHLHP